MDYSEVARDWKPSIDDDFIAADIENRMHIASDIETRPADVESLETYEEKINEYKNKGFTYIPIPRDDKFYNTDEGWVRELKPVQIIGEDTHLMKVLRLLQDEPFLLVDILSLEILVYTGDDEPKLLYPDEDQQRSYTSMDKTMNLNELGDNIELDDDEIDMFSVEKIRNRYPQLSDVVNAALDAWIEDDEDRYGIITLADINRRGVKVMLYVVFSGLVSRLARKIENEYPNSKTIFKHLRAETIGRWRKDRMNGLEVHVAEQMNMIEIMQVVQASNKDFVLECGFDSKKDVEKLNSINEIRNKVMHANKSLIYDRRDIQDVLNAIDKSQEIISDMN